MLSDPKPLKVARVGSFATLPFILASRAFRLAGLAVGLGLSALSAYQRRQGQMASEQSHGGHLDATTDQEVVFCHACAHEWYRDEHGLACPECQSDVTEIVCYSVARLATGRRMLMCEQVELDNDPRFEDGQDADDTAPP